jgi:hypothetical protein
MGSAHSVGLNTSTINIMEECVAQTVPRVPHGCDILVHDATVTRLVRNSKTKIKYQRLITNSFF